MMETVTLMLFLVAGAAAYILFVQRKHLAFGYTAALLLLIAGMSVFVQGMDLQKGQTVEKNITEEQLDNNVTDIQGTVTKTPHYVEVDSLLSRGFGMAIMFIGLHLWFVAREDVYNV